MCACVHTPTTSMAPRRSKQGSSSSPSPPPSPSPSPSPLPGIAIGIFAAVAAGFAATRALRKKRRVESQKDEEHAGVLIHERDIERNEKNDFTIAGVPESAKLVADLELVGDATKVGLRLPKSIAEDEEYEEEADQTEGCDGQIAIEGDDKPTEKAESSGEDVEISDIDVKIKSSLILDNASVKALQKSLLSTAKEDGEGEEKSIIAVVEDEDTGEDGDDDRSSVGQPLSPVLINGRVLDFFDEMSDLSDKPDLLTSGGNSFSDSVSESSMQEVSSAPVKPLVLAEEAMEASWMTTKQNFSGASDQFGQEVVLEEKNWSGVDKTSPIVKTKERELLVMEEACPQADNKGLGLKEGLVDSSEELDVEIDVHDGEPVLIEIGDNAYSICEGNKVNLEILPGACVTLDGEILVKLNKDEECREHARINGKVLSDARPLAECKELASTKQAPRAAIESAHALASKTVALIESPRINGTILCDKSQSDSSLSIASTADCGSLQSAWVAAGYDDAFEAECKMILEPTKGVLSDILHANVEVEVLVESRRDMPTLGSDGEMDLGFTRGGDLDVDSPHSTCDIPSFDSVVNPGVEPNEESTLKMSGLESVGSEELVCAEEPVMYDVITANSIKDDNPDVCDMTGWEENVDVSTDSPVEVIVESTQEMPSLEIDPLEEESLHAELPAMQVGKGDVAMSEDIEDDNLDALDGRFEVIEESTQELASFESRPLEEFNGEEPEIQPGVLDIAISNTIGNNDPENDEDIQEEQPGSSLASLEDSIERNDLSLGAKADEVELSSVMEEDEVAELGVDSRTHAKQQEIEEILSTDDTSADSEETPPSTRSLPASPSTTNKLDQVFTKGAVGLQKRNSFSRKLLRYLPIEIGLICLLIALVSFLLQYLEGSMLIQHSDQ